VLAATFPDSPYITGHARPSNGNSSSKAPWWQLW
jgi:outer membrane protein assembly factor BamD